MDRKPWIRSFGSLLVVVAALMVLPAAAFAEEENVWLTGRTKIGAVPVPITVWGALQLHSHEKTIGEIKCTDIFGGSLWNEGSVARGAFEGLGSYSCTAPELEHALLELLKPEGIDEVTIFASAELPLRKTERQAIVCQINEVGEEPRKELSQCKGETEEPEVYSRVRRRISSFPWQLKVTKGEREHNPAFLMTLGMNTEGKSCYPTETVTENGEQITRPAEWYNVPAGCLKLDIIAPQLPAELEFTGSLVPTLHSGVKNGLHPSYVEFGPEDGLLVSSEDGVGEPETETTGSLTFFGSQGEELLTVP